MNKAPFSSALKAPSVKQNKPSEESVEVKRDGWWPGEGWGGGPGGSGWGEGLQYSMYGRQRREEEHQESVRVWGNPQLA